MRRILRGFLTLSVLMSLVAGTGVASASPSDEAAFVALINDSRAASGLGPLTDDWDLTDDARAHTAEMIGAGQIYHSTNAQLASYTTGWARLGENVGVGPNPSLLHLAFMNSTGHRANILGDFDRVGVGVDRSADGQMYVTVLFMKSAEAPPPPPTTTTAPPTTTTTVAPTTTVPQSTTTTVAPPVTTQPSPTTIATPAPTQEDAVVTTTVPTATEPAPTTTTVVEMGLTTTTVAVLGDRPAERISSVRSERNIHRFRPLFGALAAAGTDPVVVHTAAGVPVVIE